MSLFDINSTFDKDVPPLDCPKLTAFQRDLVDNDLIFWVDFVVDGALAAIGLVANIVSALILGKEDMRNSFNFLLIALISMDSCFLFLCLLEGVRKEASYVSNIQVLLFPHLLYPLISIVFTASIYMTVAIAIERYIAVHYPIDYSQAINSPEACKRRLLKYVIPVIFISTLLNIPKFLETDIEYHDPWDDFSTGSFPGEFGHNGTHIFINQTLYKHISDLDTTEEWDVLFDGKRHDMVSNINPYVKIKWLRQHPLYMKYYIHWTNLFVRAIIPTVLLIYFNYKIYQDVKNRNRRQLTMSSRTGTGTGSAQQARRKQEDNLAVVFLGIVLVFLICHTPRNICNLAETFYIDNSIECQKIGQNGFPFWTLVLNTISHLLLVVNSSTNMILYIFLNKLFRLHFINHVKSIVGCLLRPCAKAANNNEQMAMEPLMNGHRGGGNGAGPGKNGGGAPVVTEATAAVKAAATNAVDTNNISHKAKTTTNPSHTNGNERGILLEAQKGQNGNGAASSHAEAIPTIVNENEVSCNNGVAGGQEAAKTNILGSDILVQSSPNKSELVVNPEEDTLSTNYEDKINVQLPSPGEASTKTVSTVATVTQSPNISNHGGAIYGNGGKASDIVATLVTSPKSLEDKETERTNV